MVRQSAAFDKVWHQGATKRQLFDGRALLWEAETSEGIPELSLDATESGSTCPKVI
jgi:hypothetical protein